MAVMRREPPILLISVDSVKSHHHYLTWSTSVLIVGRFINFVYKRLLHYCSTTCILLIFTMILEWPPVSFPSGC